MAPSPVSAWFSRLFATVAAVAIVLVASAEASAPAGRYLTTGGTVFDTGTKLTWQRTAPPTTYTWAAAKTYCQTLGTSLGGTGWRLPTVKELQTLVDYSPSTASRIDPIAFPEAPPTGVFWCSTALAGVPSVGWYVSFDYGGTGYGDGSPLNMNAVRCVR